ncbi:MAG TPA: exodeoxyribonuclease VII large subunit, partial [Tichowtungia sp.]|nr:exodeoxyribonuclease VII large subunit [Tichowtungia sp.]
MEEKRTILTVAELNRKARQTLEHRIGEVWVEGEISRLTRHSSGHWYFTLKDEAAAVSCAMFKQNNMTVLFDARDGVKVRVLGQASLYEPRGNYQLIVRTMEDAGKGSLQEQFEKLKAKLAAEGLFDADRKKPLPMLPRKIGVVTSPTGAAVRDIINVLTRRFPNLEILLAPVTVQGPTAAGSIAKAIRYLNKVERASRSFISKRHACSTFFNPTLPLEIYERNLPHWQQEGVTYFITFRLADSIPQKKLRKWKTDRELWLKNHLEPYSDAEKNEYHHLFSEKIQDWLDAGNGLCLLAEKENAQIVAAALQHFDGERYTLGEWVVMPNHIHALITPNKEHSLEEILHSLKSFTAHKINKRTESTGQIWQHESYDHIVRSPEQLYHFEQYIHNNPAKAGIKVEQASFKVNPQGESRLLMNEQDARSTLEPIDLLIVGRGGGSMEDLWAFNEEVVARAIAASQIPVISAVGHEIDFTIADFVADVRAPTPSAAAELAVPVQSELETQLVRLASRLSGSLQNRALVLRQKMPGLQQSMRQTLRAAVRQRQQRVDEAAIRITHELKSSTAACRQRLPVFEQTMAHSLQSALTKKRQALPGLQQSMAYCLQTAVTEKNETVKRLEAQLRALSPLGVLDRGYSLTETEDGTVVRDATTVKKGDT